MDKLIHKAMQWADTFEVCTVLHSHQFEDVYGKYDVLIAAGAQQIFSLDTDEKLLQLPQWIHNQWVFGYFAYDLGAAQSPHLYASQRDDLDFPKGFFFRPQYLIAIHQGNIVVKIGNAEEVLAQIEAQNIAEKGESPTLNIQSKISKEKYIQQVQEIQKYIRRGAIYELNFCQEFYADEAEIVPLQVFWDLNKVSPKPFSAYCKYQQHYIICASPERFLAKRKAKLLAQPIKGTAKSSAQSDENEVLKSNLLHSEKERSENVMIVDLMRNDMTQVAQPRSVKVEELFGIYTFAQLNHMISTVSCELATDKNIADIIQHIFPMGSMTGAPKIRAMELIAQFEEQSRGVFSGALGYFSPDGDFDFNVIIRSILYHQAQKKLSFQVGSAITHLADAEQEYEECLLKIKGILTVLRGRE